MLKILLVEDDMAILKGIKYLFEQNGFKVRTAQNVKEAEQLLDFPDIAVLDVTLPDGNGFDLYENSIAERGIPVIFLTAKDDEEDIVRGLESGAEDYLTKPFFNKELIARVNRIAKKIEKKDIIAVGDIVLDMDRMEIYEKGVKIEFTFLELHIMQVLFSNLNRVITRDRLCDYVFEWTGNAVNDNTITVYMNRIRRKLDSDIIITVKGMGYRVDDVRI